MSGLTWQFAPDIDIVTEPRGKSNRAGRSNLRRSYLTWARQASL